MKRRLMINSNEYSLNDEEILNLLATPTPYHIENEWRFIKENKNSNCSHYQIDLLVHKQIINRVDIEIMKLLSSYRYLNHCMVAYFLNNVSDLPFGYKKKDYSKNLHKLMNAGIILRYGLVDIEDHLMSSNKSPLRCYHLSPRAYSYIVTNTEEPYHDFTSTNDIRKIELLAINQFDIRMRFLYKEKIISHEYLLHRKINQDPLIIDLIYHLHLSEKNNTIMDSLPLLILPIRYEIDMILKFLPRLQKLLLFTNYHHPNAVILILVENMKMILSLYQAYHSSTFATPNPSIYFLLDTLVYAQPIFNNLFTCQLDDAKNLTVENFKLDL